MISSTLRTCRDRPISPVPGLAGGAVFNDPDILTAVFLAVSAVSLGDMVSVPPTRAMTECGVLPRQISQWIMQREWMQENLTAAHSRQKSVRGYWSGFL